MMRFKCSRRPPVPDVADDRSQVLSSLQLWRLFTSLWPSSNLMEGIVSWFLLYRFRLFEREMGSSKFAAFCLLSSVVAMAARAGLLAAVPSTVMRGIASGPYHIIFGLFPLFFHAVPKLQPNYFSICGVPFSDKSVTYMLGCQLLASGGLKSVLASAVGLAIGTLYAIPLTQLQRFRFPRFVRTFFRRWVLPLLQSDPPRPQIRARPSSTQGTQPRGDGSSAVPPGPTPDSAAVDRLVGMGFGRAESEAALRATYGDEDAAANLLLGS